MTAQRSQIRTATAVAFLTLLSAVLLVSFSASAKAATVSNGAWSFTSAPTLAPPAIELPIPGAGASRTGSPGTQPPTGGRREAQSYLFLAPITAFAIHKPFLGKPGPEILEADGDPVWQDPLGNTLNLGNISRQMVAMNFHPATYEGKPVLVWWQGYITPEGLGNGTWEIVNQQYQPVAHIDAPPGYELDFHEFQINARGMAYVAANRVVNISLHCCGGPSKAALYDQVIFEVDIATGKVVWRWDPLHHVPLRESYAPIPSNRPWDPYHLNSISFGPSGNLIVSARNTWSAYWINRVSPPYSGGVFATLGGKRSSFTLQPGTHFAWQHDIRQQAAEHISLFDDEAAPAEATQSRGLVLALDFTAHTASLVHEYLLPHPALAGSQGNVELEANGNVFVGWGQLPYFTEYDSAGHLTYEGNLPGGDESYRTFHARWVGLPAGNPAVAAQSVPSGTDLYASWNGATQIVAWQLLAGSSPGGLSASGQPVPREGFETKIAASSPGPYYAVQAIDRAGKVLGTSPTITPAAKTARAARDRRS